jgi:hypothetical protein
VEDAGELPIFLHFFCKGIFFPLQKKRLLVLFTKKRVKLCLNARNSTSRFLKNPKKFFSGLDFLVEKPKFGLPNFLLSCERKVIVPEKNCKLRVAKFFKQDFFFHIEQQKKATFFQ